MCAMAIVTLIKQIQQHPDELAALLCGVGGDSNGTQMEAACVVTYSKEVSVNSIPI